MPKIKRKTYLFFLMLAFFGLRFWIQESTGRRSLIYQDIASNRNSNLNDFTAFDYFLWSTRPLMANWTNIENTCHAILSSDKAPIETIVDGKNWTIPNAHNDQSILGLLSDCKRFRHTAKFPQSPLSADEANFPLAYVLVGTRNAAQTVRLIKMIYQPQNAYCLTYDKKGTPAYQQIIRRLSKCFDNVFVTPSPINIYYADYSILQSVTVCLQILLEQWKSIAWKYVQIVSWNDFPLKTNSEMVSIFKILNGSQDSSLEPILPHFFALNWNFIDEHEPVQKPRTIVPDGLTMYKGSYATSMTKEFVQFLFTSPISQRFYQWLKGSKCPEEHYWQTMIYNVHLNAPGSFPGQCLHYYEYRKQSKKWASRYQVWKWDGYKCQGKIVSLSCVYGFGDLQTLIKRPELIAHKVYEEVEPATMFCLEQWYWNKVNNRLNSIDASYYENFPSVRYHKMKNKSDFIC